MLIVGLCGSPRQQATEYVLKEALRMLGDMNFETSFYSIRGKRIGFCTHCDFCLKNKECAFKDDMQELYTLLIAEAPKYNAVRRKYATRALGSVAVTYKKPRLPPSS